MNQGTLAVNADGQLGFQTAGGWDPFTNQQLGELVGTWSQKLVDHQRQGILGESGGINDAYTRLNMDAQFRYQQMPDFYYRGGGKNMQWIMDNAPLTALHIAEEWAAHYSGSGATSSFGMGSYLQGVKVVADPSDYLPGGRKR
jgi:hypothetical protein